LTGDSSCEEAPQRWRWQPPDAGFHSCGPTLWACPSGLQLYTVREQAGKDIKGTLTQVAAIGYREVEIDGFYHQKPAELKRLLDADGLQAPSGHCGAEQLKSDHSLPLTAK
jgi:hypothetical protein